MRFLPTRVHGTVDYPAGALLITLPRLFGVAAPAWLPHIAVGGFDGVTNPSAQTAPGMSAERQARGTAA